MGRVLGLGRTFFEKITTRHAKFSKLGLDTMALSGPIRQHVGLGHVLNFFTPVRPDPIQGGPSLDPTCLSLWLGPKPAPQPSLSWTMHGPITASHQIMH